MIARAILHFISLWASRNKFCKKLDSCVSENVLFVYATHQVCRSSPPPFSLCSAHNLLSANKPGVGSSQAMMSHTDLELESRLRSILLQLQAECGIYERMVHKSKNQHRKSSYFQYLLKVCFFRIFPWIYFSFYFCSRSGGFHETPE